MVRALSWLNHHLEEFLLVILLAVISLVMLLQVAMRYVFSTPLNWPEELCRYCFVYSGMIGMSYCCKQSTLIRMDALISLLPGGLKKIVNLLIQLIMCGIFGFFFIKSVTLIQVSAKQGQYSPALHLPYTVIYQSMVMGFVFSLFRCIQNLISQLKQLGAKGGDA